MLKKKNMAMIMAGVTVATTVAPAFASGDELVTSVNVDSKNEAAVNELVSKIRTLLDVEFDGAIAEATVGTRVYDVQLQVGSAAADELTNATALEKAVKALTEGQALTLSVKDKGHQKLEDGTIVDYKIEKFESVDEILKSLPAGHTYVVTHTADTVTIKENDKAKEIVVKVGDNKLDFTDKITADGTVDGELIGFEDLKSDIVVEDKFVVNVKNVNEVAVSELFDGVRFTSEGMALITAMEEGTTVTVSETAEDLERPVFGTDYVSRVSIDIDGEVVNIAGDYNEVVDFLTALEDGANMLISSLAGATRFETAVEVSKAGFADGAAKGIVLVGQDAIVDGLAAAPLAAKTNAPILLSKVDGVTKEIEEEMLRVLGTTDLQDKTIYVVGGESQISKEAEEKLAKLGAKVERLSGDDRYETSLAIAEEVVKPVTGVTISNDAFVVGGYGEVDAMSIAAYAAQEIAPIVVTNKDVVTTEAKDFMETRDVVIVGGKSSVSEEVKAELEALDGDAENNSVKRLSGNDRQGTNAAVINEYYTTTTGKAFVAKDGYVGGNSQLVDALTAAPLAGSQDAPIVLSTNSLSVDQVETAELKLTGVNKIVQIGQGIADSVIAKLAEIVK